MTDEEFRALVLEAFKLQPTGDYHYPFAPNQLRHLVARAVEAEREACARICENGLTIASSMSALDAMEMWGEKFAAAIRARGSK
jgi:hypothetical protein